MTELMNKIVSLCKRRGFVFQSSEIYGGLKSSYDYGPLGTELKKNIGAEWWRSMVHERENVYGLDASVIMHSKVWEASGHLNNFSDPLVDCYGCKERFRADKAPKDSTAPKGYKCPSCDGHNLSEERQFRTMFRSVLGPIDPLNEAIDKLYDTVKDKEELKQKLNEAIEQNSVYLRPETAQAMFVQFQNIQSTMSAKVPFGIAQIGKSFRNEIIVEHFIFRSVEFEQMEMEFFCEPGTQKEWLTYWKNERLEWYKKFARNPDLFRLRAHDSDELAHYSDECYDVEYQYPWGWDELEGIASRTDYDLTCHSKASKTKLSYFDPNAINPETGKKGRRYTPYVIEPAAGLTRTMLCLLIDAYDEEKGVDSKGQEKIRTVLRLHPALAPFKAAILPLVKKDGQPELGRKLAAQLRKLGLNVSYDEAQSIGKRYAKHDEIGTPFCITIDPETVANNKVTIRDRDTTKQEIVDFDQCAQFIKDKLDAFS